MLPIIKKLTGDRVDSMEYFSVMDDEILIEMATYFPEQFKRMCMLISLDIQLEKESYEKSRSNRGTMH